MSEEHRTYFAAERTFLAWMRTGLAMMGFGIIVERFGLVLRELASLKNGVPSPVEVWPSLAFGTALVLLGVLVNLVSAANFLGFVRNMKVESMPSPRLALHVGLSIVLAILGICMATYFVIVGL